MLSCDLDPVDPSPEHGGPDRVPVAICGILWPKALQLRQADQGGREMETEIVKFVKLISKFVGDRNFFLLLLEHCCCCCPSSVASCCRAGGTCRILQVSPKHVPQPSQVFHRRLWICATSWTQRTATYISCLPTMEVSIVLHKDVRTSCHPL